MTTVDHVRANGSLDGAADKPVTRIPGQRAAPILEKETAGDVSMVQLRDTNSFAQAIGTAMRASAISTGDTTKIIALVETQSDGPSTGAPTAAAAAAAPQCKSGGLKGTPPDLLEKAGGQPGVATKVGIQTQNEFDNAVHDDIRAKQTVDPGTVGQSAGKRPFAMGLPPRCFSRFLATFNVKEPLLFSSKVTF